MWNSTFHKGLKCWVVENDSGYPLLEGEWEGRLRITNEQNALLIAAAMNADERGEILKVRQSGIPVEKDHGIVFPDVDGQGATLRYKDGTSLPYNAPLRESGYAGAIVFPNEEEDKAADFGLSPMLAGARRMGHLL